VVGTRHPKSGASAGSNEDVARRERRGLPDSVSVVSEKKFISPGGRRYRIIRTSEQDSYDRNRDEKPERR
jgi:hypothetical protein